MKKGWETKRLSEVAPVFNRKPEKFVGLRRYFSTGAVGAEGELSEPEFVDFATRPSRAGCMPEVCDIGFARMKGTKKVILVDDSLKGALFSTGFCFLAPQPSLDPRFIFHFVASSAFQDEKNTAAGEGIMGGIKNSDVAAIQIPHPPLAEQHRIVGILDEAFEGIAIAKANAEKNLQSAHDLYSVALETSLRDLVSCEMVELGSIIEVLTDYHANGSYEVLRDNVELKDSEDFAWMVRSTDFEKGFQNEKRYITKPAYYFLKKSQVFGGDIIMSKIGNAGKVYLMPEVTRPCSLAMNLFLIRLDNDRASNAYVYHFLKSERGEKQILSRLKGAATQTITKESVRSLLVPLPPRSVQDRFVAKIDALREETQRLATLYTRKLAALEALKKSLLHQAFSGEL